jgi:hypothetical protein
MKISARQLIKEAGTKEKKRASGINFDHVKEMLSQGGVEVPRQDIDNAQKEEANLVINSEQMSWIEALNLDNEAKAGRLSEHESYLLIVGSAITSNSLEEAKQKLSKINTYFVTNHEIKSGSFSLNLSDLSDYNKIRELFDKQFAIIDQWTRNSEERASQSSGEEYKSTVEADKKFEDGWKVVYIPAAGEMEEFPGLPGTSHDRILEGNKNGLCLGSNLKLYQDNKNGKIFSVRDPENKPRVTIRIENNELEEAKGKGNQPPDVDGCLLYTSDAADD